MNKYTPSNSNPNFWSSQLPIICWKIYKNSNINEWDRLPTYLECAILVNFTANQFYPILQHLRNYQFNSLWCWNSFQNGVEYFPQQYLNLFSDVFWILTILILTNMLLVLSFETWLHHLISIIIKTWKNRLVMSMRWLLVLYIHIW